MNKKFILIIICFLCGLFIFFNSSQTSTISNNRSHEVENTIINIANKTDVGRKIISKINYVEFNLFIRKCAHAFEFFILSIASCNMIKHFKNKSIDIIVYTSFIVLFLAVIDECFQLFIPNRTSSVADVLIDFCGGIVAQVLFFSYKKIKGNI